MLAKWDSLMQAITLISLLVKKKKLKFYSILSSAGKDNIDHLLSSMQTPKVKETLVELAKA